MRRRQPSAPPSRSRRAFLGRAGAGAAGLGFGAAGVEAAAVGAIGLDGAAVGAAGLGAGALLAAAPARADVPSADRRLSLVNAHTGELLDIVYFTHGMYIDESLAAINHLMRDHRANEERIMDPHLLDDLARLHASLGTDQPLHLLSGYRTPATNARLRKRSKGVAKYSLHMEGRAADIHVPGLSARQIQEAALAMRSGGVGYYARSGFVHIDTGAVRHWERG